MLAATGRREEAHARQRGIARLVLLSEPLVGKAAAGPGAQVLRIHLHRLVEILGGPGATLMGDADQLDQLLINLLKNAVDATLDALIGPIVFRALTGAKLPRTFVDRLVATNLEPQRAELGA